MMNYKNRTNKSCAYDAFEQAGIPVTDDMLNGVRLDECEKILVENGYKVFRKNKKPVVVPDNEGFFVFRVWGDGDDAGGHVEYHVNIDGVPEYDPKSICAIAIKK